MTTMREALELARDVIAGFIEGADPDCGEPDCGDCQAYRPAWAALPIIDAALAEPEPQPVAWMTPGGDVSRSKAWCDERCIVGGPQPIPLYAAPVSSPAREIGDDTLRQIAEAWGRGRHWHQMMIEQARAELAAGGK